MTAFDPRPLAETSRRIGLGAPVRHGRQAYEPDRIGHAGVQSVLAVVLGWLLGERDRYAADLVAAESWLADAERRNEQFGDDPVHHAIRRRRALALARWMLRGDSCAALWRSAAEVGAVRLAGNPHRRESTTTVSGVILDALSAGPPKSAVAIAGRLRRLPDPEGQEALAVAEALARDGWCEATLTIVGKFLRLRLDQWLDEGDFLHAAAWLKFAVWGSGATGDPEAALLMAYPLLPGVPLPPALQARGWIAPEDEDALAVLPRKMQVEAVDRLTRLVGLTRDPDRADVDPTCGFASWSGGESDDREIDYHWDEPDSAFWLEVRGRDHGPLAGALAAALGGRIGRDPDAALAERITVPPGAGPARLGSNGGALRWAVLRQAIAAAVPENARAVNLLITAGLADPDWRVRMTAVLAVGRMQLCGLAEKALAAPVPAAGRDGLSQEDRRMLLALRQAAHDRAAGVPPHGEAADPEIAAKRREFQARLQARLAKLPETIEDRADALLLGLLGGRAALNGQGPGAWRSWLD